jgi:hypothetical protein
MDGMTPRQRHHKVFMVVVFVLLPMIPLVASLFVRFDPFDTPVSLVGIAFLLIGLVVLSVLWLVRPPPTADDPDGQW